MTEAACRETALALYIPGKYMGAFVMTLQHVYDHHTTPDLRLDPRDRAGLGQPKILPRQDAAEVDGKTC